MACCFLAATAGITVGAGYASFKLYRHSKKDYLKVGSICATEVNTAHPNWNAVVDNYVYVHNAFRNDLTRMILKIEDEIETSNKKQQQQPKDGKETQQTEENNKDEDATTESSTTTNEKTETTTTSSSSSSSSSSTTVTNFVKEFTKSFAMWKEAFHVHSQIEDELFLPILLARLKRAELDMDVPETLALGKDHVVVETSIDMVDHAIQECTSSMESTETTTPPSPTTTNDSDNSTPTTASTAETTETTKTTTPLTGSIPLQPLLDSLRELQKVVNENLDLEECKLVPLWLKHFEERELWALSSFITTKHLNYCPLDVLERIGIWWFENCWLVLCI